ncbi:negative elongation factor E-like [Mizuhopecten yessoensis]|uniref:Negative elongation factor E n=1 Tax=Mizuhopecten yessoensis TaxID=6573 RepID=A0A210PLU1_MIZYE|nr:negative elongation factor E-like [Mizuhopecten yessoensis]OWF37470.1 Negative elongation factor E [Mizuhopecten yessoensis]
MGYINFPARLTDEEEKLRQKYALLRKKKKILQALKTAKPEREVPAQQPAKRPAPESAEDAKEQAKKLLKSGAIKIASDSQDKHSFKRTKFMEKKLKDPEKTPSAVGFQPFQATHPEEEEREIRPRQKVRALYDNFVSGGFGEKKERDIRVKEPPPRGNTIYVHGHGVSEEILRKAFSNLGNVVNVNMEKDKNVGFVTFEKMESADSAISEVNNAMIDGVQLRVSMARRQPSFEQATDPSTTSWSSIAASSSQKGSHKDKRAMVTYDEQDIF